MRGGERPPPEGLEDHGRADGCDPCRLYNRQVGRLLCCGPPRHCVSSLAGLTYVFDNGNVWRYGLSRREGGDRPMQGHIRKRGKRSWAVVLSFGRDPVTGKKKQKWLGGFRSRREAQAKRAQVLVDWHSGGWVEPT